LSELVIQNCLTIYCTLLLSRHKKKQFLYQIVTGEKWIYYNNPKHKKIVV